MPGDELRQIRNFACQGTDLEVRPGELLVLLGPNGAGKTTLLNVIAGLVPHEGSVLFDGVAVDAVPARQRRVGYVFQDLVLFPHLDVAANIAYGLRGTGRRPARIDARVRELLELLAITHLAARHPARLSGGEQQRVALARALAPRPEVLLLDEPFNSLDTRTSALLRAELKHLQRELGTTTVFVTHDLAEAEEIADRVAVVLGGIVQQIGAPQDVLFSPRTEAVSELFGSPNLLACRATRSLGHGLVEVDCAGLQIVLPGDGEALGLVAILPRDVVLSLQRPAAAVNVFEGVIQQITPRAGAALARVALGEASLAAEVPGVLGEGMRLRPGARVFVELGLTRLRGRCG